MSPRQTDRHKTTGPKRAGGLGLGLVATGLVTAVFFALLFLPTLTGTGKSPASGIAGPEAQEAGTLKAAFDDEPTQTYLEALRRTFPAAASDLEADMATALAQGAGKDQLGLLALRAGGVEIWANLDVLARADVSHAEALLSLLQTHLEKLSASGAPYCTGDDLLAHASLPQQGVYRAMLDRMAHGEPLYKFALSFNTILLDAIQDARDDPVLHSRFAGPDQAALRELGVSLMAQTRLAQLLTTEGKTRTEMDEVFTSTDFCELGETVLDKVDTLPSVTKGRLWAMAVRLLESGAWRWYLYQLQSA